MDTVAGASVLVPLTRFLLSFPLHRPVRLDLKASEVLTCLKPPEGGLKAERAARASEASETTAAVAVITA